MRTEEVGLTTNIYDMAQALLKKIGSTSEKTRNFSRKCKPQIEKITKKTENRFAPEIKIT